MAESLLQTYLAQNEKAGPNDPASLFDPLIYAFYRKIWRVFGLPKIAVIEGAITNLINGSDNRKDQNYNTAYSTSAGFPF
jgi:hypothetical protein